MRYNYMYQYTANKNVVRRLQKVSLLTAGSLRQSGSEFHTNGPATEEARRRIALNISTYL